MFDVDACYVAVMQLHGAYHASSWVSWVECFEITEGRRYSSGEGFLQEGTGRHATDHTTHFKNEYQRICGIVT